MLKRTRGRAAVTALALFLVVACSRTDDQRRTELGEPRATDRIVQDGTPPATRDAAATPGAVAGDPEDPDPVAPSTPRPASRSGDQASGPSDSEALGTNAFYYLNGSVPELVIEIDVVDGAEPSQAAIDLLVQRLRSVVDKPRGIRVLPVETIAEGRATWTVDQVRAFERKHRDTRSTPERVAVYLGYLDGETEEGNIGMAYGSSSMAVFAESIRANALPTVPAVDVEKATLVHEMGHLLALVNLTYTSPRDHEDPEHRGHSKNIDSVMYWEIDNVGVFSLFRGTGGKPPTDFDADDRADLADLKTGKLG